MYDIVYFSNVSGNTKRFVNKLPNKLVQIPIKWDDELPLLIDREYVIVIPTYGGGADSRTVPKSVIKFLNVEQNRALLKGIVGTGDSNFGAHYCKAAEIIAAKTGAPLLYKVEITGTPDDVEKVKERLELLWKINTATTN